MFGIRSMYLAMMFGIFTIGAFLQGSAAGGEKEDETAIRQRTKQFLDALSKKNAKKVASFWTEKGEYTNDDGIAIRGHKNLEGAYADYFAKEGGRAIDVENSNLRFLSKDSAIMNGSFLVKHANPMQRSLHNFTLLLVRENDQWRFALLRESPAEPTITEFDWLEGVWEGKTKDGSIRVAYAKEPGGAFLRAHFEIKNKEDSSTGTQMIGRHPTTGIVQSWSFGGEGGISQSKWIREDKRWILATATVLPDGGSASSTSILTPIDQNSFSLQSTANIVDGEKMADAPAIRMRRVKGAQ